VPVAPEAAAGTLLVGTPVAATLGGLLVRMRLGARVVATGAEVGAGVAVLLVVEHAASKLRAIAEMVNWNSVFMERFR